MTRIIVRVFAVGMLLSGCNRGETIEQQQAQQRETLQKRQQQEQAELAQRQQEQLTQARQEARADLRSETQDLQHVRMHLQSDLAEVKRMMGLACTGVARTAYDTCPIQRAEVTSITNIDRGVVVNVDPTASIESFEQTVSCYQGRVESRAALTTLEREPMAATGAPGHPGEPTRVACLLDRPGLSIGVSHAQSGAAVQITTEDAAQVPMLQDEAATLVEHRLTQLP